MSRVTHIPWIVGAVAAVCGVSTPFAVGSTGPALIVVAARSADAGDVADARAAAQVQLVEQVSPRIGLVQPQPGTSAAAAARELGADPAIASVEVDRPVSISGGDPLFGYQWSLDNGGSLLWFSGAVADADIDAPEAWTRSNGTGATVAVVDTGVRADHPDLAGAVGEGWDYWDDDADPSDEHGHGTHVAGIIAARAGNDAGVVGIAPNSTVMPLRVLNATGRGLTSLEIQAFAHAAESGVKVVNASFGSGTYSASEDLVIHQHPETLFVVAAGNDTANLDLHPTYPCSLNYDNVLCVGASTVADLPASFSNYGAASVDLFAPGENIASTWLDGGYALDSGTSMAAPLVAGTAALVAAAYPTLSANGLRAAILDGVDHPVALAGVSASGGRLNANGALIAAAAMQKPKILGAPPEPSPRPVDQLLAGQNRASVQSPVTSESPAAQPQGRMLFASVTGRPKTRGGTGTLVLRLSHQATVEVRLQRRRCASGRCRWQTEGRLVDSSEEGLNRLPLRGRTPQAGRWRAVAMASASSSRTVEFSVRP